MGSCALTRLPPANMDSIRTVTGARFFDVTIGSATDKPDFTEIQMRPRESATTVRSRPALSIRLKHVLLNLCEILLHPISFYDLAMGVLKNFQQPKRDNFAQQHGFYGPSKIKINLSEEN